MIDNQNIDTDAIQVILNLKERVYDHERFSLEEYLVHLGQTLWKFHGLGLDMRGDTLEEKCERIVDQLIKYEFIKIN